MAKGDGDGLYKLFFPSTISSEMLKKLEKISGKEFSVDGRR